MKLSRLFQSKASAFREAIAADDLPRMEKLMEKKSSDFLFEILGGGYVADITPRMTELFIEKLDAKVLERWNFKHDSQPSIFHSMFGYAVHHKRQDIADTLLEKNAGDFNRKGGAFYLQAVIESAFDPEVKMRYLRKILSTGNDRMTEKEKTITAAVEKNDLPALDLLAAAGFKVDGNALLASASRSKSEETALHLAAKYGANVDAALSSAEAVGNDADRSFFEKVKAQLPQAETPRTVESLTAEVESLRETVRDLHARLGEKALDKPVLRNPAP